MGEVRVEVDLVTAHMEVMTSHHKGVGERGNVKNKSLGNVYIQGRKLPSRPV